MKLKFFAIRSPYIHPIYIQGVISALKIASPQIKKNTCLLFCIILQVYKVSLESVSDSWVPLLVREYIRKSLLYNSSLMII